MKIVLIGSGNLAMHLGPALKKTGHQIVQVVGRTEKNAIRLAKKLSCKHTIDPESIAKKADVYIIALRDEAISEYIKYIPSGTGLVLHTSGSIDIKVFSKTIEHFGVFYPVQSFSLSRKINFSRVPLCLEGNSPKAKKTLLALAKSISDNIHWVNFEQRQTIHLAAVFANNFSNHLFTIAEELLGQKGISFDLLRQLVIETAAKVQKSPPHAMQTGPARRGDTSTIENHLSLLKNNAQTRKIYEIITQSIRDHDGPRL